MLLAEWIGGMGNYALNAVGFAKGAWWGRG